MQKLLSNIRILNYFNINKPILNFQRYSTTSPRPNYTCLYQKDSDLTIDNIKQSKFQATLSALSRDDLCSVNLKHVPSVDVCGEMIIMGYQWKPDQIVHCKRTGKLLNTFRISLISRKYFVDDLAVLRTKTKKRVQNICSIVFATHGRPKFDYIVLPRLSCLTSDYHELVELMEFGLNELHSLIDNNHFKDTYAVPLKRPDVDHYYIRRWNINCSHIEKLAVKLDREKFEKQKRKTL